MANPDATQFEGSHIIRIKDMVREVIVTWLDNDPDHIGWWYDDGGGDTNGAYDTSQDALVGYVQTFNTDKL